MNTKRKFRIRELRMPSGEVRFVPEKLDSGAFSFWTLIGDDSFYLTMEQAKQQIDQYRREHPEQNCAEIIHNID